MCLLERQRKEWMQKRQRQSDPLAESLNDLDQEEAWNEDHQPPSHEDVGAQHPAFTQLPHDTMTRMWAWSAAACLAEPHRELF